MPRRNPQTAENRIIRRIYDHGRGWVLTSDHFLDIASRASVRVALKSICDRGIIRRLSRGVYDYPEIHPDLGPLQPSPESIVRAISTAEHRKIQPSGAYAANLLGLTEQVPARIVFLTDGPPKKLNVGGRTIMLNKTTPKNMAGAGRLSGLLIQALKHLRQPHVTPRIVEHLARTLTPEQKAQLLKDIKLYPDWIGQIVRELNRQEM